METEATMHNKHHHHNEISEKNEKRVLIVILFTLAAMVAEIAYGYITNSMALLADGYHMGTHALALGLTYIAYILMRKFANSDIFVNGTEKIGTLAGYTSSLFLGLTGLWIIIESIERFLNPLSIKFDEAIIVAIIGLFVNAVSILIMETKNKSEKQENDYNYKAAYYHILADAITSILAILALLIGKFANILFLDSIIGIIGGILILKWAINLIKKTVSILIDIKINK